MHRSVALALLLQQRGFMDVCDASVAPIVVPVFKDLAGCDRAAAAAEAMPKSRLINAPFVCKVMVECSSMSRAARIGMAWPPSASATRTV